MIPLVEPRTFLSAVPNNRDDYYICFSYHLLVLQDSDPDLEYPDQGDSDPDLEDPDQEDQDPDQDQDQGQYPDSDQYRVFLIICLLSKKKILYRLPSMLH